MNSSVDRPNEAEAPWWRHPYVWMVIGGPACVVVASFVTLGIAIRVPDPVVSSDYYKEGLEINRTLSQTEASERPMMPALAGRNHAATPNKDVPAAATKP